jgi:hypothetical protein
VEIGGEHPMSSEEANSNAESLYDEYDVLCISDIAWEPESEETVDKIQQDIQATSPSLVLFSGDVINDGMNSQPYVGKFLSVLDYLEECEIQSCTLSGNHDGREYKEVIEHIDSLAYAYEVSDTVVKVEGLKIAGISYAYTHSLRELRGITSGFPDRYDIVLAHAENRRRPWLFELDSKFVITGHFAERLCEIDGSVFVSLHQYPSDCVFINTVDGEVRYKRINEKPLSEPEVCQSVARIRDGKLDWLRDDYEGESYTGCRPLREENRIRRRKELYDDEVQQYSEQMQKLLRAKERAIGKGKKEKKEIARQLCEDGVASKTLLMEYIERCSDER